MTLHHRTTDPATRAWHVAERDSLEQYKRSRDIGEFFDNIGTLFEGCLQEFAEEGEKMLSFQKEADEALKASKENWEAAVQVAEAAVRTLQRVCEKAMDGAPHKARAVWEMFETYKGEE